jgi:tRNA/rRNA methyltransferase
MTSEGLVVVLVEPAGPLNVGSVARLCANFKIGALRLVNPRCDHLGAEARLMAVHGAQVLEQARCFTSLEGALADCRRVVATSGRCDGEPLPLLPPAQALGWLMEPAQGSRAPVALVFGREDRGLSNDELLQAGRLLTLGTAQAYRSLNLSHAVAMVLHALHELRPVDESPYDRLSTSAIHGASELPDPCQRQEMEAMLRDAEDLLLEVGFLYPHTRHARMAKVRQLLQRAQVSSAEVALIRGMVRQLRWASAERSSGQTP